jgi:hypothetical protein
VAAAAVESHETAAGFGETFEDTTGEGRADDCPFEYEGGVFAGDFGCGQASAGGGDAGVGFVQGLAFGDLELQLLLDSGQLGAKGGLFGSNVLLSLLEFLPVGQGGVALSAGFIDQSSGQRVLGGDAILPEFVGEFDLGLSGLQLKWEFGGFNFAAGQSGFALRDFGLEVDGVLESLCGGCGGGQGLIEFGLTEIAIRLCAPEFQSRIGINQGGDGLSRNDFLSGDDQDFVDDTVGECGGFDCGGAWFDPAGGLEQWRAAGSGVDLL